MKKWKKKKKQQQQIPALRRCYFKIFLQQKEQTCEHELFLLRKSYVVTIASGGQKILSKCV